MKKRIIFDIFNVFLTRGYDGTILEMEKMAPPETIQEFIDNLYEKLPDFFFEFILIDTLFRLRDKADVYFFSRYNDFTTNCILTRLGVNGLFSGIVTPKMYNTGEFNDALFFSTYGGLEIEHFKMTKNKRVLAFEKIWPHIE